MALEEANKLLRNIPSVDSLITDDFFAAVRKEVGNDIFLTLAREALQSIRIKIKEDKLSKDKLEKITSKKAIKDMIEEKYQMLIKPSYCRVINGTGIILHTGLGRAVIAKDVMDAVNSVQRGYCLLEVEQKSGQRSQREVHVVGLLKKITGAEAATVVNNNAGAVVLSLTALAKGKETIISRGQLVEIGGSFRVPDVMSESGTKLVEVGTTNKTYVRDFEEKINPETALLLRAHSSNYRIMGFTESVSMEDMVAIGKKHGVPVMDDIGSGNLIDLRPYGIDEPLVQDSVSKGVDIVTFSGDKLLGGPQAGIIVGKKKCVDIIRRHPLFRALRPGKFTLVALEATLKLYLDKERLFKKHPTLYMITKSIEAIEKEAKELKSKLEKIASIQVTIVDDVSEAGGGSAPVNPIKTKSVAMKHKTLSPDSFSEKLRLSNPCVFARISKDRVCIDVRTLIDGDIDTLVDVIKKI